jgi:type IV secretion system protein TrbL
MENLNIIDDFLSTFSTYLDSGFGLLGGDVHALSTILIGIDVTLAGLFWTLGGEDDVLAKFIRKILYIGAFAYIIGNYAALSTIIFKSFSQAGITAAGGSITADQLLKPGASPAPVSRRHGLCWCRPASRWASPTSSRTS